MSEKGKTIGQMCFDGLVTRAHDHIGVDAHASDSWAQGTLWAAKRIALLEKVAIKARMYIDDIGECDFIELDEALTTAGYPKGEDTWNCHQCCHSFPDSHKPVYLNHVAYCSDECADNRMAEL